MKNSRQGFIFDIVHYDIVSLKFFILAPLITSILKGGSRQEILGEGGGVGGCGTSIKDGACYKADREAFFQKSVEMLTEYRESGERRQILLVGDNNYLLC